MAIQYTFEINSATETQVPDLNELLRTLSEKAPQQTWQHWRRVMRANTLLLCVEEKSGKVVGMVTLMQSIQPYGNFATIEDVATHPDHQRKGLSEALVKIAIDTAREAGYDTIKLTSKPKRAPARSLYEKLGFKSDGETEKFKLPLK